MHSRSWVRMCTYLCARTCMQSIAADARVHCASLSRDEMIDVELTNEVMDEIVQGNSNTGTNAADFFGLPRLQCRIMSVRTVFTTVQ